MRVIGRYVIHEEIGSGGMAMVHMGRLQGPVGFARTVAIKRLHDQFAKDPEFVEMFLDEARLAARIQHPNVVPILDVVAMQGELFLVLEYVHGVPLTRMMRRLKLAGRKMPPRIAVAIGSAMLAGLHAAHEARRENGEPLGIVHRDVNPQNVLVGEDGGARVLDFGIAKASYRYHNTASGVVKGKLKYMAPEQVAGKEIDRRTDVFAASAVIWEMLTGEQFIKAETPAEILSEIVSHKPLDPSKLSPDIPVALDCVVLTGLAPYPKQRYQTAAEMAADLETTLVPATARELSEFVSETCGDWLEQLSDKRAASEAAVSPLEVAPPQQGPYAGTPAEGMRPAGTPAGGVLPAGQQQSGNEISSPSSAYGGVATPMAGAELSGGPLPVPRATPRLWFAIVGGAFVAALTITLLVAVLVSGPPARPDSPAVLATGSEAVSLPVAETASAAEPAASAPAIEATAVASASAPVPVGSAPLAAASASAPKPKQVGIQPVAIPAAGHCKPPYTIGADGVKRYKPECF